MKLFNNNALMDVIRCDQNEYLIWKWSTDNLHNKRENAIRYGSSLRVKEGEMAVFVYKQNDGTIQDFITGPYDGTIKTANFPILSNIVGLAFGGNSPFQAEIYFINLQGNNQIRFGIPWFDVFDPRYLDFSVPVAARGTITFNITDYKKFIKLNRMIGFDLEDFYLQIKSAISKHLKTIVTNAPTQNSIPVIQIERKIAEISDLIQEKITEELSDSFGINLKRFDLATLEFDKESEGYKELRKVTAGQTTKLTDATTDINIVNLSENMRIQRKDAELQVEGKNFPAHQLDQQTEVLKTAAENLGSMSTVNMGGGGMSAAGMAAGMMIGQGVGGQMAGMVSGLNTPLTPPSVPVTQYHIALNGTQQGLYTIEQIKTLIQSGQFTKAYHVWKPGMGAWELAENHPDVSSLFTVVPPPPPSSTI